MEDNAKIIINVAGDYVQSKYVEYEIALLFSMLRLVSL